MKEEIKVHNLKAMSRYSKLMNIIILFVLAFAWWLILPSSYAVGPRNMIAINAIFCCLMMFFMIVLEKYSSLFSDMEEKTVINVLSTLYTFVIMLVLNGILFISKERLIMDLAIAGSSLVFLCLGDFLLEKISKNSKHYRMPRMLIISSDESKHMRMKRIKYGALSAYESWYENLEGLDIEDFKETVAARFPSFDAICILDELSEDQYNYAVKTAIEMEKDLYIVPNMIDAGKTNAKIVRFDDVLALYMPKHRITTFNLILKRMFDIILGSIGMIVAAIPMLIIAFLIKVTSPGPVFYKQERMTINKKRFMIYKFRTMIPDAEKLTGPKFAEKDDPRITKIGKILRACRLDELPQIINILNGDMSIVGPRPERPIFIEQFENEIENYDHRFAVKAGLTSLSHVYGRYSTYIHDRTYYDLFYITNYSLWMDIKIMLLTSKTMFIKSAAEGEDLQKQKTRAINKVEKENVKK